MRVVQPLFDRQRALAFLKTEDTVDEVLRMAIPALRDDVRRIKKAIDNGQTAQAVSLLLELKGFIPMFCSDAFTDRLNEVYQLSKSATAAELQRLYSDFMPLLVRLREEIEDSL